ncbi:hypothetical protein CLF_102075 [Clonorchis sinensis]|uniref:Uncharacterized protein n=1 Tax=Clonorchis sinensis TaxID=79923 RepID=G7Y785_CLOSI|nr:hypothetical protein CLF_102075 [Clonorchis sinensis]
MLERPSKAAGFDGSSGLPLSRRNEASPSSESVLSHADCVLFFGSRKQAWARRVRALCTEEIDRTAARIETANRLQEWIGTAVIPYKAGTSEVIRRVLNSANIRVAFQKGKTLRSVLDKPPGNFTPELVSIREECDRIPNAGQRLSDGGARLRHGTYNRSRQCGSFKTGTAIHTIAADSGGSGNHQASQREQNRGVDGNPNPTKVQEGFSREIKTGTAIHTIAADSGGSGNHQASQREQNRGCGTGELMESGLRQAELTRDCVRVLMHVESLANQGVEIPTRPKFKRDLHSTHTAIGSPPNSPATVYLINQSWTEVDCRFMGQNLSKLDYIIRPNGTNIRCGIGNFNRTLQTIGGFHFHSRIRPSSDYLADVPTQVQRELNPVSRLGQPGTVPALVLPSGGMAVRHREGATAERTTVPKRTGSKRRRIS